MARMHGSEVVGAFHEPPVWSPGFSRSGPPEGGTPYRWHDPDGFMVPMHGIEVVGALHEPTHPRPLPGGEHAFARGISVPLLGGVRGGFRVPLRVTKRRAAFHERLCSTPGMVHGRNESAWTNRGYARAFFISESPSSAALGMLYSLVDGHRRA